MKNVLKKVLKAKQEMGTVIKGSKNDHFRSRYADLNAYLEVVDPVLESNGLLLTQPLVSSAEGDMVVTTIQDVDTGESLTSSMRLLSTKNTMQDLGSAVTYARRYTLSSLLGLGAEDDDGEAALGRGKSVAKRAILLWGPPGGGKSSEEKEETPSTSSFRKKVVKKSTSPVSEKTEDSEVGGWE